MSNRSAVHVIASARQMIDVARIGQQDYEDRLDRGMSGLYQAVTSGRAVSFVLQNLRGSVEDFDEWYGPVQQALKADPICKWFVELRNRIEKQGTTGDHTLKAQANFSTTELPPGPEGTIRTRIGDKFGRNHWEVQLADGSVQNVYFLLPAEMLTNTIHIENAPDGRDVSDLLEHYLSTIEKVVDDAELHFLGRVTMVSPVRRSTSAPSPTRPAGPGRPDFDPFTIDPEEWTGQALEDLVRRSALLQELGPIDDDGPILAGTNIAKLAMPAHAQAIWHDAEYLALRDRWWERGTGPEANARFHAIFREIVAALAAVVGPGSVSASAIPMILEKFGVVLRSYAATGKPST